MTAAGSIETPRAPLYREVAAKIEHMIGQGVYRPGERLPSIRELGRRLHVAVNTIKQAYVTLESSRRIEARPRSGYYVSRRNTVGEKTIATRKPNPELVASRVRLQERDLEMMRNVADEHLIPLGRGAPSSDLLPSVKLNRMLAAEGRRLPSAYVSYAASQGVKRLRTQIAKRSLDYGCALSVDDIVVTSGCVEAVTLALQATCSAGDTIAVESPVYYTFLNAMQFMGLKVLEIPSSPHEGVSLDVLSYALRHNDVRACIVISSFNNPLGSLMPEEKKRELVRLLAQREIPLIEDDVYGDLCYGDRPPVFKAYDEKGLVLLCSSFSKTLAPGYRVGWIAAGRFQTKIESLKSLFNIATATPTQLAVAQFLCDGGFDRHLRTARRILAQRMSLVRETVAFCFPPGTRTTNPQGGFSLWVEMPEEVDAIRLYEQARQRGIAVAPGPMFTLGDGFRNCLRINCSFWTEEIRQAVQVLGALATNPGAV